MKGNDWNSPFNVHWTMHIRKRTLLIQETFRIEAKKIWPELVNSFVQGIFAHIQLMKPKSTAFEMKLNAWRVKRHNVKDHSINSFAIWVCSANDAISIHSIRVCTQLQERLLMKHSCRFASLFCEFLSFWSIKKIKHKPRNSTYCVNQASSCRRKSFTANSLLWLLKRIWEETL